MGKDGNPSKCWPGIKINPSFSIVEILLGNLILLYLSPIFRGRDRGRGLCIRKEICTRMGKETFFYKEYWREIIEGKGRRNKRNKSRDKKRDKGNYKSRNRKSRRKKNNYRD